MPVYEYKALNSKGKTVSGILDCDSVSIARQKLRAKEIFPVKINEISGADSIRKKSSALSLKSFSRISPSEISMMTRQTATLLASGFPLLSAIETLIPQTGSQAFKKILSQVKDSIEEGSSFAAALSQYPWVFSEIYVNMVRAGETSGTLEIVLERLADISEKQMELNSKVKAALAYPIFMFCIGALVLFVLLTFIVPNMTAIFSDLGQALPAPTRILLGTSQFFQDFWWIIAGAIAALIFGFNRFKKTEKGTAFIDKAILHTPVFGPLARKLAVARFSRTLGSLLENGVTMLTAMGVVKNVVGNVIISSAIEDAAKEVEQGHELGAALDISKTFPYLSIQMIKVGEQSGKLETLLDKVADVYDKEVESSIVSMTSLLEPAIILLMGVAVGFIVFAICLPIFEMNQLIS